MENIKTKKVLGATITILFILTVFAQLASAEITASIKTDKTQYCPTTQIQFKATVKLTECEQLKSSTITIGDKTCSLPRNFGSYPSYGSCNLNIIATETNPDNCYIFGGSNTIDYKITYALSSPSSGSIVSTIRVVDYQNIEKSASTTFLIKCDTTTSSTTTTSTTTTTYCTNNTCPCSTTTTTTPNKRRSNGGGDGSYPAKPSKVIASCKDEVKNFGETDIDCGGTCPACEDGKHCLKTSDCINQCINGICQTPSCMDGYQNQDETDTDCGGKICDKCIDDKKCIINEDCESNNCENGICRPIISCTAALPNCTDGIRNQDESDIDCGGTSCDKCEDYMKCSGDGDCFSNYCFNHVCKTPTCSDGVKNQNETDTDCGGPCNACEESKGPGVIGYMTAISGGLANILLILIVLLLLGLLGMYLTKRRKYVATADFLDCITDDAELEKFINKNRPGITASTSRKIRRIKKFLDEGKIDIVWIKDWDYINELILKGLDDNNAESIALAKQMNAGLFIKNEEAKKIAECEGIKVYDK